MLWGKCPYLTFRKEKLWKEKQPKLKNDYLEMVIV